MRLQSKHTRLAAIFALPAIVAITVAFMAFRTMVPSASSSGVVAVDGPADMRLEAVETHQISPSLLSATSQSSRSASGSDTFDASDSKLELVVRLTESMWRDKQSEAALSVSLWISRSGALDSSSWKFISTHTLYDMEGVTVRMNPADVGEVVILYPKTPKDLYIPPVLLSRHLVEEILKSREMVVSVRPNMAGRAVSIQEPQASWPPDSTAARGAYFLESNPERSPEGQGIGNGSRVIEITLPVIRKSYVIADLREDAGTIFRAALQMSHKSEVASAETAGKSVSPSLLHLESRLGEIEFRGSSIVVGPLLPATYALQLYSDKGVAYESSLFNLNADRITHLNMDDFTTSMTRDLHVVVSDLPISGSHEVVLHAVPGSPSQFSDATSEVIALWDRRSGRSFFDLSGLHAPRELTVPLIRGAATVDGLVENAVFDVAIRRVQDLKDCYPRRRIVVSRAGDLTVYFPARVVNDIEIAVHDDFGRIMGGVPIRLTMVPSAPDHTGAQQITTSTTPSRIDLREGIWR